MTSTLEVSGAVDGEIFKRNKMGRVGVPRARREALLTEFERGGTAERSLPNMWGSIFDLRQLDPKAAAAPKTRIGIAHQSRTIRTRRTVPVRWLETMVDGEGQESPTGARLRVHLPGGAHLEITNGSQAGLAAVLIEKLGRLGARGC